MRRLHCVFQDGLILGIWMCPDERFYYHIAEADATEPLTKEEIWEMLDYAVAFNKGTGTVNYFWDMMAAMTGCGQLRLVIDNLTLADRYDKVNKRRRLIRARAEAGFVYLPTEIHSSSVINNLTRCNCFIDLKAGRKVEPGDKVRIRYIKGL